MPRLLGLRITALIAASTLTLAGCASSEGDSDSSAGDETSASTDSGDSSDDSTDSADDDATDDASEEAGGEEITADAFSFTVPEGWTDILSRLGDPFVAAAADVSDTDGFNDHVNVAPIQDPDVESLEDVEASAKGELETAGATNVEVLDRVEIDGEETSHISAEMEQDGTSYHIDQYYTLRGEPGFILTYATNVDLDETERAAVIDEILSTWTWN